MEGYKCDQGYPDYGNYQYKVCFRQTVFIHYQQNGKSLSVQMGEQLNNIEIKVKSI